MKLLDLIYGCIRKRTFIRTFQILMIILLLERYIPVTIYRRNWS